MRWRGQLGSFLLRDCSLTLCNLSSCSCRVGLHSALLFLLWKLSLCSFRFGFYSVPSFPVIARGFGVVVAIVAGFPGGASSFSIVQPSLVSSARALTRPRGNHCYTLPLFLSGSLRICCKTIRSIRADFTPEALNVLIASVSSLLSISTTKSSDWRLRWIR